MSPEQQKALEQLQDKPQELQDYIKSEFELLQHFREFFQWLNKQG